MDIVLDGQDSKFARALSATLDSTINKKLHFDKAVISQNGACWHLFFSAYASMETHETQLLEKAVKMIVPNNIELKISIDNGDNNTAERFENSADIAINERPANAAPLNENDAAQTTEKALFDDVPMPDESCAPPEESFDSENNEADIPRAFHGRGGEALADDAASSGETAIDRYKKRMEALSFAAAQASKDKEPVTKKKERTKSVSKDGIALYGKNFEIKETTNVNDINEMSGFVTICGDVIAKETKALRDGKKSIFTFAVTDYTSTITCKLFVENELVEELEENINGHIAVQGRSAFDDFSGEVTLRPLNIKSVKQEKKTDDAPIKRIEMHLHTKMSQMDGVVDAKELVKLMMQYGHDTVAITDHGVVQAYPDMEAAIAKCKADIKLIFGVEGYLLDDDAVLSGVEEEKMLKDIPWCVYSMRTTSASALTGEIMEIGACIYVGGVLQEKTFHSYCRCMGNIDGEILDKAGISRANIENAPPCQSVMKAFFEFAQDCVLVSHNANSSAAFLRIKSEQAGIKKEIEVLDTLRLSRELVPNIKSGKFNKVCDALEIRAGIIENALKEAEITAAILRKLIEILEQKNVLTTGALNAQMNVDNSASYHIIIYATNKKGLLNLYTLITESHLHHLRRKRPQIPRSLLKQHREGLIISSACEAGELYRAILHGASEEKLRKTASFYDYLEVQPLGNNEFLVREGAVRDKEHLIELNKKIIELGEALNKPVIATGDVHYLLPRDAVFRSLIQCAEGYPDADIQAPLYYRTTQEMLDEFYYLDEQKRYEIVVKNPRELADKCEKMESFPRDHLYTPEMDNAEEELREMCEAHAHELYGDPLPEIVRKRLDKELTAIIKHGYAVLYLIAHKVVKKSLSDGYLVGSRGSVGSSFAATMANITEVNPLQPHYVCPECKYSDFDIDMEKYDCGIDLPVKQCPKCGTTMMRLGFNIPFEVFMGFDGDKVPDIDLNFSGVYQPVVHKYIEELFGEKYVFRAGTIGGVADKTAIGYTKKYCEEYHLGRKSNAEIMRLAAGCIEVKRTTGQHAGGVVILPKKYDINEFTPLQYPANDPEKGIITTHFTFESLHDTILKADILGHDDPTMIRMLEDLTGIDAKKDVPLDDPKVMDLFLSTKSLGVDAEEIGSNTGTFGIPEFGTAFTRKMLEETKPKTFSDLVKISGLSHGTDVWTGNAQELIAQGIATISECICTREDIMNNLLQMGVAQFTAFDTMEKVRKGKGIPEKYLNEIHEHNVPEWFIESCNKIKYMFPKAHAAAYVTMAIRIAWFKVYRPHQYYAAYFTVRADDFDVSYSKSSPSQLRALIKEYHEKPSLNPREKGILVMLEIALEMKARGIEFDDIDIYASEAVNFTVTDENKVRPPLNAVPGLGETAAYSIVEARKQERFKSQDDLLSRTKLSSTLLQALDDCGCLKDMPKSQQISLFDVI